MLTYQAYVFKTDERDSPTRFSTFSFFHHWNQSWLLTNGLKLFLNLVKNSQKYSNFKPENLTLQGIIPR